MRCVLRVVVLALGAACVACGGGHEVRQTALVPAAAAHPPPTTKGNVDFYVGGSTPSWARLPDPDDEDDPDLWVPRVQLDGAVSTHLSSQYALRFWIRYGVAPGAERVRPTDMPRPGGGVLALAIGNHLRLGRPEQPGKLDFAFDLGYVSVPTVHEELCAGSPCADARGQRERRDGVLQIAVLVLGRWAVSSWLELMGGVAWQTHPTNEGLAATTGDEPNVEVGPLYSVPLVGVEIELTRGVHIVPTAQWPLGPQVFYGPTFALAVRGVIYPDDEEAESQARPPPRAPPPQRAAPSGQP